jgi:hypothetical protein
MPRKTMAPRSGPNRRQRRKKITLKGVRHELLPGDGGSFTVTTPIYRAVYAPPQQYKMVQESTYGSIGTPWLTTSTTASVFASQVFQFSQVDQYASLAAVFDQYKITEVEFWLIPQFSAAASTANAGGLLSTVVDLDDAASITFVQASDYASCLTTDMAQGHYRRFVPHAAVAVYSGAFSSYGNVASPWIDTSSPSVYHYGIKAVTNVSATSVSYDIRFRLHLTFKSVR